MWALSTEIIPRTLFMRSRLPLVFTMFVKAKHRTMVGLALFDECESVNGMDRRAKAVLINGRPRRSVWIALVHDTLKRLGGRATLAELYQAIEPRRPTSNPFWREKIRQSVQVACTRVEAGVWELPRCAA